MPANDWQGVHAVDDSPSVENPPNGWVYNTNNWPYTAAGPDSPKKSDFPAYFDRNGENPRGVHALRVLTGQEGLHARRADRDGVRQPAARVRDAGAAAGAGLGPGAGLEPAQGEAEGSDRRCCASGTTAGPPIRCRSRWPTSGARKCGRSRPPPPATPASRVYDYMRDQGHAASSASRRWPRSPTSSPPTSASGRRRGARSTASSASRRPSSTRSTTPSRARRSASPRRAGDRWPRSAPAAYNGSKKIYGTSGNSFVAAVEFGKDGVRAKAVTAGGLSSDIDLEALQRPGRALRHRQPARGLLLPEAARRSHREDLQAGSVGIADVRRRWSRQEEW